MTYISPSEEKFLKLLRQPIKSKEEIEEMRIASKQFSKELKEETSYLLQEIRENGLIIDGVYDLVNTSQSYPEAIEPLRKHLSANYHIKNKEGIVRALGVKEAGMSEVKALINEYGKTDNENLNWCIAMTIKNIMSFYKISELRAQIEKDDILLNVLISHKKLSLSKFREYITEKLGNTKKNI